MSRPKRLVVVVGTATEVGKTFVSAQVLRHLRSAGHPVAARKPVQSFDPESAEPRDAEVLAAATGEDPDEICDPGRCYPVAMAPPMAAEVLGTTAPATQEIVGELSWPDGIAVGLVEAVGGVRSPLATDGDSRDLSRALDPDLVVVVADAGLGVIDAARAAVDALRPAAVAVYLNRFRIDDDLHVRNLDWLRDRDGIDAITDVGVLADRILGRSTAS